MGKVLARALLATAVVAVAPVAFVWGLEAAGVLPSAWIAAAVSAVLSLAVYHAAARAWARRPGTGDVLFGDLMVWGWARRAVQQRRLGSAVRLLGVPGAAGWQAPADLALAERAEPLERLAHRLEARDPYTHGHAGRVTRYSAMIAIEMGLEADEVAEIRIAAAVHDVGKVLTPLEILHKPGRLTPEEFAVIERHPVDGEEMVAPLNDAVVSAIVRSHHERLDGSGYPDGLRGDAIPLGARIVAVADTFDAITSTRSYRSAKPHRLALDILREEAGTRLDSGAVDAFSRAYLARRPLTAWLALVDTVQAGLAWLAGEAVSSGARLAAVAAAGGVAVGAGALPVAAAQTAHPHLKPGRSAAASRSAHEAGARAAGTVTTRDAAVAPVAGAAGTALQAGQRVAVIRMQPGHGASGGARTILTPGGAVAAPAGAGSAGSEGGAGSTSTAGSTTGQGSTTGNDSTSATGSAAAGSTSGTGTTAAGVAGVTSTIAGTTTAPGTTASGTPAVTVGAPATAVTTPVATVTTPSATVGSGASATVTVPRQTVTTPVGTLTTPSVTVTTPSILSSAAR